MPSTEQNGNESKMSNADNNRPVATKLNSSGFKPSVGEKTKSRLSSFAAKSLISDEVPTNTENRTFQVLSRVYN